MIGPMRKKNHNMKIFEADLYDELFDYLIAMSRDWEAENSTHGYRKNEREDIEGNRIFLAVEDDRILAYLFGREEKAERTNSIMQEGTTFFEVEELYVIPACRSKGIGRALFSYAEQSVKEAGISFIMLSTASKNFKSILHFYIDELGMEFWSARLFKRVGEENFL